MARVEGGAVILETDWPGLKNQIDVRKINFKYEEDSSAYEIFAIDGQYFYKTIIYKSGEAPQNQATFDTWRADFEANYKNRITDFNSTQPFYLSNVDGYSVVLKDGATPTVNDGYGLAIMGYDGANYRMLRSDTSGRPILVGAGTAGTPAGGVITIQGSPSGTALPISGSVTVSGTVTATNPSVGSNNSAIPTSSTQIGGSDGTNLQASRVFDLDTGGGQQWVLGVGLRKASGGGSVEAGTSSDPIRIDPTGTTTQPVSGTVAATQSGTWTVQPGNTANTTPWLTTISQGGNSATVSAAGALKIDGSAVTQPVSGTVTANAGTGNFTVVQSTAANLRAQLASESSTGSGVTSTAVMVGGSDGTNLRAIFLDSSGRQIIIGAAANGAAVVGNPILIAGSDGTNARSIRTASDGTVRVDPTGTTTQPISGTVTANAGTGTFTVSGTVTSNIGTTNGLALDATLAKLTVSQSTALGTNTQALVGGSVTTAAPTYTTGNINPLSLTTAGALRIDGSSTTQPISGTVTANIGTSGSLALDATLTGGTQRTKITDGTTNAAVKAASTAAVAADPALVVVISPNNSVAVTGTVTANNASVSTTGATPPASATYIGGSVTTAAPTYTTGQMNALSLTTAGLLRIDGSGVTQPVSGTVAATQSGTWTVQPGNTANTTPWLTTISQGGNSASVSASNALKVDGSAVTQPVSGTITANIGTSGALALDATLTGGTQTTRITDGTNTATVKAASTSAVAADKALVVAISPNNTVAVTGTVTATNPSVSTTGTAPPASATYIGGSVTTAAPTYTTGQMSALSLTTTGLLRIDGSGVTQPVSGTVSATQSGTWTVQPGNTANTTPWLTTISQGGNSAIVTGANALKVDGSAVTQPISGTVTANIGTTNGLALDTTLAKLTITQGTALGTNTQAMVGGSVTTAAPTYTTGQISPLSLTTTGSLRIDGSGSTQPVSGTVAATQSGTWTIQPGNTANTTPWLTTISQGGNSVTVTGANALKVDGSSVTQPVSGTVTANIGTTNGLALDATLAKLTITQSTALGTNTQAMVGGSVTTAAPTYTTGNINPLSLMTTGALRIDNSSWLGSTAPTVGSKTSANSIPVVIASDQSAITITGTVTATNPSVSTTGTAPPASATYMGGSVTTAAPTYTTGQMSALSLTTTGLLRIDGSGVTQPISAASLPLPTGAATEATLGGVLTTTAFQARINTFGQKTMANSTPVVLSSDQTVIPVSQSGTWTVQPGNTANTTPWLITISQGGNAATVTGANALKVDGSAVTQPVSGTVTANIGTTNGLALDTTLSAMSLVDNAAFTDGTTRVQPVGYIFDEVAGTALTENDTAAARIDSKRAQISVIEDATTRGTRATIKAASTAAVAGDTALVVAISPNNSISISGAADATSTGTLNALNAAVTLAVTGNAGAGFQLAAGTLVGTIVPEVSTDGGTTWMGTWFVSTNNDIKATSLVFPISNILTVSSILGMNGASHVRVRVSAFTSGTANASLRASAFQRFNLIAENFPGIATNTAIQVGGSDGSALRALRVASDGTVRVDPTGTTTQPVSGTVTANIGTSGSLALEATQVKLTIAQSTALGANTQTMVGGSVTTAAPTYTTGNINPLSLTTAGALRTDSSGTTQPISGTVTANIGTSGSLALDASITAQSIVDNAAFTDGTTRVQPVGYIFDEVAGTALTENDAAAARIDSKRAQINVIEDATTRGQRLTITAANAAKVDGSAVTQPVSGTVTANIGTSGSLALDASITAQSVVDNAAFTDGTTRVQPVGFVFDDVAGTALTENDAAAARIDSKRAQVLVIEDGTTRGTKATVKAASTAAVAADPALVVAISPNNSIAVTVAASGYGGQIEGRAADGAAPVGNPVLMAGWDGANVQTILTDTSGRVVVAPSGATSATSGFSFGDVTLTTIGNVVLRRTTLTEQTSNAQRSVVSSSASDASAGTGARQVRITYYDSTGAGPSTETITLNGTTPVNTVSTTICYVEKMDVISVGSTGSNVGAITLKAATAGGGATIMTMSATDNQMFLGLHYVPTGKTCFITGLKVGSNASAISQGGLYILRAQDLSSSTAPNRQVSDFFPLYGQSSGVSRQYDTPIQVVGPARIQVWVNPFSNNTVTFMGSFDFYDQ